MKRSKSKATAPRIATQIVDINLLPRDRRPAEFTAFAVAAVVVLLVCVAAMIPLALNVHEARASAKALESQASGAQRGVQALQLSLTRQRGIRGDLELSKMRLATLEAQRAALQGGKRPLQQDLTMLFGFGAYLPAGVRVTAVAGADRSFKVDGIAPGPLDAIAYANMLATSGGFTAAHMASFAPAAKDGGQFSIEVAR